jgi:hypothetical protein
MMGRKKTKQTICQTCGSVFDGKGRTLRYCSESCRLEMLEKRKSQVTGEKVCQICGESFAVHSMQHLQKYCSAKCRKRGIGHKHTCEQCGKEYLASRKSRRFCSNECRIEACRKYHECEGCGKTFLHRASGGPKKDENRFCNKQCCGKWRKRQNAARRQAEGDSLRVPYSLTAYELRENLYAKLFEYLRKQLETLQAKLERNQLANWLKNGPCEECGKAKGLGYSTQSLQSALHDETRTPYLCNSCLRKSRFWEFECKRCFCDAVSRSTTKPDFCKRCQKRRHRHNTTHKKRCKKRGLPYNPAVKTSEVGERANWRCEICQKKVMRVWKTHGPNQNPYDMGPTIDHIVPLRLPENTKHGHTWENTQLACWKCNTDKNDDCELWLTECDDPRKAIGLSTTSIFSSILPDM